MYITIENQEKLGTLENNVEFNRKLANAETPEEVQEILKDYNVDMSTEEVSEMIQKPADEMSESDLDQVAGGCFRRVVGYRIKWVRIPPLMIPVPVLVPVYR